MVIWHQKPQNWVETLAVEAETAITYINKMEQNYLRYCVLMTIKRLLERNLHDKKNVNGKH
jgi:hypothetical protein